MALMDSLFRGQETKTVENAPHPQMSEHRKKLRWLVHNPPADLTKLMIITPEIAKVMMERNQDDEWKNRPHSERGLKRYIKGMKAGWKLTGETIIFSKCGCLLNGQNRLLACIESGASFQCLVVFGIERDAFKVMDCGIARTAGHIFAIDGVPNYNHVSAIARMVYSYMSRSDWDGQVVDVENEALLDFYRKHERIQDSLPFSRAWGATGLLPQRWAGALHYICAKQNREAADRFFQRLIDLDFSGGEYERKLYRTLDKEAKAIKKASSITLAAYTVQAWNAHRGFGERKIFRWRGEQINEAFPRAR